MPDVDSSPDSIEELDLDSSVDSIITAGETAARFAREFGLNEDGCYRLGLAVHEAVANAVVHGNRHAPEKRIRMWISFRRDRITVTIRDEGEGFDSGGLPDWPDPRSLHRSGRGLPLMREFVNELSLRHHDEPPGTEVRLIKNVRH
ncbi:ATP-binding protein [Microtetraspora sp. NBRC 16547]|uniref:ATP-binding protein n=1 Tax=Microtetraspora sp. NBRC 16547 TaxID=3030993 RepID=UPI002556B61C|nr:ATP-binding protein [Microtetraspora sp. NBRC 16547]